MLVPQSWTEGIICPIYKNKGDVNNPDNYSNTVTVLSCFGKLFTAVLNCRLNSYLENMNLLCEELAGFRKGYSTMDHAFNLTCLVDLYLHRHKQLFVLSLITEKQSTLSIVQLYGKNCCNKS